MTVIAAMLNKEGCWLGCDAQATSHNTPLIARPGKALQFKGIHVLLAGVPVTDMVEQALLATFAETKRASIHDFTRMFHATALECGWPGETNDEYPPFRGISMIVTDGWRLYVLDGRLIMNEFKKGEAWAEGSGASAAMGAFHVCHDRKIVEYSTMKLMIEAACTNDVHCGRPAKVWFARRNEAEWRFR